MSKGENCTFLQYKAYFAVNMDIRTILKIFILNCEMQENIHTYKLILKCLINKNCPMLQSQFVLTMKNTI